MKKLLCMILVFVATTAGAFEQSTLQKNLAGYWSLSKEDTATGTTNQVTNGTFDSSASWDVGTTNWVISGGTANLDGTQTGFVSLFQLGDFYSGETYKITYTVSNYVAGTVSAFTGDSGYTISTYRSANGTYTETIPFVGTLPRFYINADADFIGSIDNVIVYDTAGNIIDLTPNRNTGVRVGTTWTTDREGNTEGSLLLNGTSDYIDLNSSGFISNFGSDTKGSISLWVNALTYNNVVFGISNSTNAVDEMYLLSTSGGFRLIMDNSTTKVIDIAADTIFSLGQWYNIVITQDGTTSKMYINGVLQANTDSGEWFNDMSGLDSVTIGVLKRSSSYLSYINASLSDFRYYSGRALTQTEVTRLYKSGNEGVTFNAP